jgi:hypothetical protein
MREMLEGRLEWEKSARSIAVKIPARRGSAFLLFGPIIGVWMIFSSFEFLTATGSNAPENKSDMGLTLLTGFVVSLVILLAWVAWAFTSDALVTVDETQFKIQRRILGIELVTHSFSTTEVHNFKYVPPRTFWASKGVTDIRTSKIEFQAKYKSVAFAHGVTELEAQVLIEQMIEVFKFPDFIAVPKVAMHQ